MAIAKLSVFVLFLALAHGKNIFQQSLTKESQFMRIGQNTPSINGGDRGVQSVYFISRTPSVWGTAWLTCRQAMNGQLLTVETKEEDLFIRDLLIENQIPSVWTSGAFDADLGRWRWVSTLGDVSYANWLTNEPAAQDTSARVAIKNSLFSHGWHTADQATEGHYICEVRLGEPEPVEPAPVEPAPVEPAPVVPVPPTL